MEAKGRLGYPPTGVQFTIVDENIIEFFLTLPSTADEQDVFGGPYNRGVSSRRERRSQDRLPLSNKLIVVKLDEFDRS